LHRDASGQQAALPGAVLVPTDRRWIADDARSFAE